MKRLLCILVLLLVVGSVAAPFASAKAPALGDSYTLDASTKTATISKHGGVSKLKVEPAFAAAGITVTVEQRPDEVEYNWVLAQRPASNVFTLKLTLTNCDYYYQPPLTSEYTSESAAKEFGEPCTVTAIAVTGKSGKVYVSRPEDIVGSYAVYSTYSDGVYETGKVAHIYRPLVTDAKGKTTWGVLKIEGDVLTVTVNQKWLDAATYPVTVDPTFGYTTIGGSFISVTVNYLRGTKGTSAGTGGVQSIHVYAEGASAHFKGVLVYTSDLTIAPNGVSPVATIPVAAGWGVSTETSAPYITAQSYYVCIICDNSIDELYYDTGVDGDGFQDNTNSYATPTNPTDGITNEKLYSLYATYYTESDAATISDMNDVDNVYAMKGYYSFTATITHELGATSVTAASLKLVNATGTVAQVKVTGLDGGASTWSIITGSDVIDLDTASCTWSEAGTTGTAVFKVRCEWDISNEVNYDLASSMLDTYGCNSTWTTAADYCNVITRLVTRDFTGNVTATTISMPVEITGRVRYATTPTGDNSSTSYPPNAQFTQVKLYTGGGDYAGADAAIVNGFYNITVTTPTTLGAVYYYTWIDMAGDYVDGYAPDADYVAISVGASFSIIEQVNEGFTFFGLTGAVLGQIVPTITAFATWFASSALNIISLIYNIMTAVTFAAGSAIYWLNHFVTFFVKLFTEVGDILDGTSTAATSFGNFWTYFGFSAWVEIVPILLFLYYVDQLPKRSRKSGRGNLSLIIGDLQVVSYLVGEVWNWSFTVFNFVTNMVMTFVGVVTG